jgi:hypothetical protein
MLTEQKVTSPLTQARVTRKRTRRRRGALRRSSTMTAMSPLLHQGMTTMKTLDRKRKQLIRTSLLIILASLIIQMLIFLSIPLSKPTHFDGEDYSFWSHKMRSHLFSLHPSIWEIVEMECISIVLTIIF